MVAALPVSPGKISDPRSPVLVPDLCCPVQVAHHGDSRSCTGVIEVAADPYLVRLAMKVASAISAETVQ
jgi:hypothetical protein